MGSSKGNGTAAATRAGYGAPHVAASRLLRNAKVKTAMELRVEICPAAATREQLQSFWTQVMLDDGHSMKDRLRASELLAKSRGEFIGISERQEERSGLMMMSDGELIRKVQQTMAQRAIAEHGVNESSQ